MAKCNIQIPDVSELRDQIINKAVWCYRDAPACKSYSPYVREHLVPQQKSNHHWNLKNQILSFYLICDSHLNCYIREKNQNMIFIVIDIRSHAKVRILCLSLLCIIVAWTCLLLISPVDRRMNIYISVTLQTNKLINGGILLFTAALVSCLLRFSAVLSSL